MKETGTSSLADAMSLGVFLGKESAAGSIIEDLHEWIDEIEAQKTNPDAPLSILVAKQQLLIDIIQKIDEDYNPEG